MARPSEAESERGRLLLEEWRGAPVERSARGASDQAQIRALSTVLRGVSAANRRRTVMRRALGALAVAAGVVGLGVGGWMVGKRGVMGQSGTALHQTEPSRRGTEPIGESGSPVVTLARAGGAERLQGTAVSSLSDGTSLEPGTELRTGQAASSLRFPSGALVEVERESRLRLIATGGERKETLWLERGAVDVEVPRLAQPVEFSVRTPDVTVVVHGTHFRVEAAPGAKTQVSVTRGLVAVLLTGQPEVRLTAGQSWPPPALDASPGPALPSPQSAPVPAPLPEARELAASRASSRRQPSAGLAAQNRLFSAAMASKRAGRDGRVLARLQRLIAEYPESVLIQEARVEQFRALKRLGRSRDARARARQYLRQFPDGFARDEAQELVDSAP
jgi:hypothetical protein